MQQQEELIEDEQEQEEKEEVARRAKREADELEARLAQSLLPDSEVGLAFGAWVNSLIPSKLHPVLEEESARMTTEQLKELAEALSIMSARSSVLKERDELRALMEENLQAEEVSPRFPTSMPSTVPSFPLLTGSQVSFRRVDQAHPNNAYQDRQPTPGIRFTCRQLSPDDLCRRTGSYLCPGLGESTRCDQA